MVKGDKVHWERVGALLALIRTPALTLAAAVCIAVGAFLIYVPAGWVSLGVLLFVLEALTGDSAKHPQART